jgi:hypothetical protein
MVLHYTLNRRERMNVENSKTTRTVMEREEIFCSCKLAIN